MWIKRLGIIALTLIGMILMSISTIKAQLPKEKSKSSEKGKVEKVSEMKFVEKIKDVVICEEEIKKGLWKQYPKVSWLQDVVTN